MSANVISITSRNRRARASTAVAVLAHAHRSCPESITKATEVQTHRACADEIAASVDFRFFDRHLTFVVGCFAAGFLLGLTVGAYWATSS